MAEQTNQHFTKENIKEYLRDLLFIEAGLLVLTIIICYLIGWRSLYQFAEGLTWAGAIVALFGASAPLGFWRQTRSLPYQYASTRTEEELYTRIRRDHKEGEKAYAYMFLFFFAGVIAILLSVLVHNLIN